MDVEGLIHSVKIIGVIGSKLRPIWKLRTKFNTYDLEREHKLRVWLQEIRHQWRLPLQQLRFFVFR